jgi:hypothetical protein
MKDQRVGSVFPTKSVDRQFAISGNWALATDGVQWILQRRRQTNGSPSWRPVAFVRSTAIILVRCMREHGVPPEDTDRLIGGLPGQFGEWADEALAAGLSGLFDPCGISPAPSQCSSADHRRTQA